MTIQQAISHQNKPKILTVGTTLHRHRLAALLAVLAFFTLCWPTLLDLSDIWLDNDEMSHGLLIPFFSIGLLWHHRKRLAGMTAILSWWGFAALIASLGVYLFGVHYPVYTLQRVGMLGILVSGVWFTLGARLIGATAFSWFFLLFALPPPGFIIGPIRLALKSINTRLSCSILETMGYHAEPSANIIWVDGVWFEVADACSGTRSLFAISATTALFAYLFKIGLPKGLLIFLTAIPVAMAVNTLRIVTVVVALLSHDINLTADLPHKIVGYVAFALSVTSLYASIKFYDWFFDWRPSSKVIVTMDDSPRDQSKPI